MSDSGKFFVFEGPRFQTKEEQKASKEKKKLRKEKKKQAKKDKKKDKGDKGGETKEEKKAKEDAKAKKKAEKTQSGGKKAPRFYIFRLEVRSMITGQTKWSFVPFTTQLFPLVEDYIKVGTTQTINYKGMLSQCTVKGHRHDGLIRKLEIVVKNYKSQDTRKKEVVQERSLFSFGSVEPESPESQELYMFDFDSRAKLAKDEVLARKIASEQKRVNLGAGDKDNLFRL